MRMLIVSLLVMTLTGCGTVGGTISGVGSDLSRAGDWIKSK
jgi:predicted small secreted protein